MQKETRNPAATMPDQATHKLWCLVDSDSTVFKVTPYSNINIYDLKKPVKEEKKPELDYLVSASLAIWKVRIFWTLTITVDSFTPAYENTSH